MTLAAITRAGPPMRTAGVIGAAVGLRRLAGHRLAIRLALTVGLFLHLI